MAVGMDRRRRRSLEKRYRKVKVTEISSGRKWTTTFERLPAEKQTRILGAAKHAFATYGFVGANINKIAESAGISVGSMYKYFRTKEDLFLALIEEYHTYIASFIDDVLNHEDRFARRVEALLKGSVQTSLDDPEAVQLYIACTTEEISGLSSRLSFSIEEASAVRYRAMVEQAQARGEVDPALDPGWAAFFLDDIFLMTQFSVGSDYYRTRLRLFVGADGGDETQDHADMVMFDTIVPRLLTVVLRALEPRPQSLPEPQSEPRPEPRRAPDRPIPSSGVRYC